MNWQLKFLAAETAILNKVLELLPEDARKRFDSQLSQFNKIQRLDQDAVVQLYIQRWFMNRQPNAESLFVREGEYKLAKLELTDANGINKVKSSLYVVGQRLFSIEFSRSPRILGQNILVGKSEILLNPMEVAGKNGSKSDVPREALPEDYDEVAGTRINGWNIFSHEEIYSVMHEGLELYLLAEKDDYGWIAMSLDDESEESSFFFVRIDDYGLKSVGKSLRQVCSENGAC